MSNGYSFVLGIQLKKHIQMKLVRCPECYMLMGIILSVRLSLF